MKNKILIAEDEEILAEAVEAMLTYNNYDVTVVYNGQDAVNKALQEQFDIIILDIMMPIMNGIDALKTIRNNGIETPILLLTAKSQIDDKVNGLDSGANDYLTKPFNKKELLARIRALIRNNQDKKEKCCIGNILYDKETAEISNQNIVLHLNNKECELIEFLIKNKEREISSDELCNTIWKSEDNGLNIVQMYISYLQNKFTALNANVLINENSGKYVLENKV